MSSLVLCENIRRISQNIVRYLNSACEKLISLNCQSQLQRTVYQNILLLFLFFFEEIRLGIWWESSAVTLLRHYWLGHKNSNSNASQWRNNSISKTVAHVSEEELHIEDIYSFAVNTINIFIQCNENISIFTSAKHEWKFECFHFTRWKFFGIHWKRVIFLSILLITCQCEFLSHNYVTKQNMNVMALTFSAFKREALERRKQKVSAN